MIVRDKNQTLKPPAEMDLVGVYAEGAFLKICYAGGAETTYRRVEIYLNDMGREVLRTEEDIFMPDQPLYGLGQSQQSHQDPIRGWWEIIKSAWTEIFRRKK